MSKEVEGAMNKCERCDKPATVKVGTGDETKDEEFIRLCEACAIVATRRGTEYYRVIEMNFIMLKM